MAVPDESPSPQTPTSEPAATLRDPATFPSDGLRDNNFFPAEELRGLPIDYTSPVRDAIRIGDAVFVHTRSRLFTAPDGGIRLKDRGEAFVVLDRSGDIQPAVSPSQGFYLDDTRFLSHFEVLLNGQRPEHLSTSISPESDSVESRAILHDERQTHHIHIRRETFVRDGTWRQRLVFQSYAAEPRLLHVTVRCAADFADMFEVRGAVRARRGTVFPPVAEQDGLHFHYAGLDDRSRVTKVAATPPPSRILRSDLEFDLDLPPGGSARIDFSVAARIDGAPAASLPAYDTARSALHAERHGFEHGCRIASGNLFFDAWMQRSWSDLRMLLSDTPFGPYPHAGIPWFNTKFGRDGIITALLALPFEPEIAKGVLGYLGHNLATETDEFRAAQPGKVLHEVRGGEMAQLGEVPFQRYYGTVDATPLAVVLASEYLRVTHDLEFISSLWPSIQAELQWIDVFGGADGFAGYKASHGGLKNQSWKDSGDSMFHADGSDACQPITGCEIPAYIYAAKQGAAYIAEALGFISLAAELHEQAQRVKTRYNTAFWDEGLQSYGLALDGERRLCAVQASNAGHALFTGIVPEDRIDRLAASLFAPPMFSGWGIRTLAAGSPRFDPLTYHNGSIWPHDNALIALGLGRCGRTEKAAELVLAFLAAASTMPLHRLPELFSGEERRDSSPPVPYPVACAPQAWAAAAGIGMLQGMLGLEIDGAAKLVRLNRPRLPAEIGTLRISRLRVGAHDIALSLDQAEGEIRVTASGAPEVRVQVQNS